MESSPFGKCSLLNGFFPSALGGFPAVGMAGQRVSAAVERKKSKAGGKRKQKRGKKEQRLYFPFLVKLKKRALLTFPSGRALFHETLCVRSSTGQAQRYRCWQLGPVSSGSTVPAFWSFWSPSPHGMGFVVGEVVMADHHFMAKMLGR